jgi:hypothetical protein
VMEFDVIDSEYDQVFISSDKPSLSAACVACGTDLVTANI